MDFQGIGSRELTHTLWRLAGIEPKGDWVIKDDTAISKWNVLQFCRSNHAYVVVGYIPALTGKMQNDGMEILVKNDPVMRRPYIVMEANPKNLPGREFCRRAGAGGISCSRPKCRICCSLLAATRPAIIRCFFPSTPPNCDQNENETRSRLPVRQRGNSVCRA